MVRGDMVSHCQSGSLRILGRSMFARRTPVEPDNSWNVLEPLRGRGAFLLRYRMVHIRGCLVRRVPPFHYRQAQHEPQKRISISATLSGGVIAAACALYKITLVTEVSSAEGHQDETCTALILALHRLFCKASDPLMFCRRCDCPHHSLHNGRG